MTEFKQNNYSKEKTGLVDRLRKMLEKEMTTVLKGISENYQYVMKKFSDTKCREL